MTDIWTDDGRTDARKIVLLSHTLTMRGGQITKNQLNLIINNSKPDLHNINAHTKFGENTLVFTGYRAETKNMDM